MMLVQTDARRHAFSRFERPPTAGSTVELTIDEYLQHIAERELHAGVLENRAVGGSAIMMNPRTGEILAMANEPTFNPNAYRESDEIARRNRAVQDLYEPGSTFKIVTASAAIEEKVLQVDALIDTNPGRLMIGSRADHRRCRPQQRRAVVHESDRQVEQHRRGQDRTPGRDGTAEPLRRALWIRPSGRRPIFPPKTPASSGAPDKWTDSALASVSMGYQIAVTPLQMVAAVSVGRERRRAASSRASSARCITTACATRRRRRSCGARSAPTRRRR